jgi:hypothetical protein
MTGALSRMFIMAEVPTQRGELDEEFHKEKFTVETTLRFWPELGLLPLYDQAMYQDAPPSEKAKSGSSGSSSNGAGDDEEDVNLWVDLKAWVRSWWVRSGSDPVDSPGTDEL